MAANDIVDALEKIGYTQKEIAKAAGASDRSVRNWAATGAIRPQFNDRIRELFQMSLLLSDSLTWRGVTQWMSARNRLLDDQRPIDLIAHDETGTRPRRGRGFPRGLLRLSARNRSADWPAILQAQRAHTRPKAYTAWRQRLAQPRDIERTGPATRRRPISPRRWHADLVRKLVGSRRLGRIHAQSSGGD